MIWKMVIKKRKKKKNVTSNKRSKKIRKSKKRTLKSGIFSQNVNGFNNLKFQGLQKPQRDV